MDDQQLLRELAKTFLTLEKGYAMMYEMMMEKLITKTRKLAPIALDKRKSLWEPSPREVDAMRLYFDDLIEKGEISTDW